VLDPANDVEVEVVSDLEFMPDEMVASPIATRRKIGLGLDALRFKGDQGDEPLTHPAIFAKARKSEGGSAVYAGKKLMIIIERYPLDHFLKSLLLLNISPLYPTHIPAQGSMQDS
jgi:hypothetical protein